MEIIGIDIGTSTISAVVMDSGSLTVVHKRTVKNNSFLPTQHPWERIQDVQKIIVIAKSMLEEILRSFEDISAIGLTGQMHGIVYVDRCGKAVSPLYTWQDGCGNLSCFDGRSICDILAQDYGVSASTGYGMVTYLYHSRQGLVPRDTVSSCTVSDYLGMELTGGTAPLVHISQAAGMGLFDHKSMDFSREILAQNGADPEFVPQVAPELTTSGAFHGIPVCVSLGDNHAGFLGSVRDGADTVLVNVGTGAQVSVLSSRRYEGYGIEARPLTKDSCLLVGAAICAFAMIKSISLQQWLSPNSFQSRL